MAQPPKRRNTAHIMACFDNIRHLFIMPLLIPFRSHSRVQSFKGLPAPYAGFFDFPIFENFSLSVFQRFHREQRQVEFIKGVQHPGQFCLIAHLADYRCDWSLVG
jgi:hypothetical protein